MFYIVNEEDGHILESQDKRPDTDELQAMANSFNCSIYVIRGEHAGMTAAPGWVDESEYEAIEDPEGSGKWGVEIVGGVLYEPDYNRKQAVALAMAHNAGAATFEQAVKWLQEGGIDWEKL